MRKAQARCRTTARGIDFSNSTLNFVGGTTVGAANKIAFNGGPGFRFPTAPTANSIRGNSIFSNAGLGIDLGPPASRLTTHRPDFGANNLQNFRVLTSVSSSGGSTTIQGTLKSTPNFTFDIDSIRVRLWIHPGTAKARCSSAPCR
jgi:hypothetical protein